VNRGEAFYAFDFDQDRALNHQINPKINLEVVAFLGERDQPLSLY
jgi:hypothetical protein